MAESTEADRYLLKRIAAGDETGWAQLVARYQGRLLAFARRQLRRPVDAEDHVQDTFIAFLRHRERFDPERSVETFLFTTLRRRIIDTYRGRGSRACLLGDVEAASGDVVAEAGAGGAFAADQSASWYVRRDEQNNERKAALARALDELVGRYKEAQRFDELRILEMLFYAQLRNGEVARLAGVNERTVATMKYRWLHELADAVRPRDHALASDLAATSAPESLLTEVWEDRRPTCPKRSTLGRRLLGTLEEPWSAYVAFHVETLGCRFCRANVDDLKAAAAEGEAATPSRQDRMFQSTVGFFRRA